MNIFHSSLESDNFSPVVISNETLWVNSFVCEIYMFKIENNMTKTSVSYSSLIVLKNMITAKERYKDIEDKYIRTYPINGSIGVKSQLKRFVENYEQNIKNYNKFKLS